MLATVLTDNTAREPLCGEWGLSIFIEHNGHKVLLDTGETDLFLQNARKLNIPIEDVEYGILSHAHYDHSDGMPAFFEANRKAQFSAPRRRPSKNATICVPRRRSTSASGTAFWKTYEDRIVLSGHGCGTESRRARDRPSHGGPCAAQGQRASMFVPAGNGWQPDAFAHEQSLVFEIERRHCGFQQLFARRGRYHPARSDGAFPGREIRAMIGGLHLFIRTEDEVRALAQSCAKPASERSSPGTARVTRRLPCCERSLATPWRRFTAGKRSLYSMRRSFQNKKPTGHAHACPVYIVT